MGRKKTNDIEVLTENEPLSEFQDTAKTGRADSDKEGAATTENSSKKQSKLEKIERERKPIEVRGATLKSIFCNYSYDHTVAPNTTNAVTVKSEIPVHRDLTKCFKKLVPHLAAICDEINPDDVSDITLIPETDPMYDKIGLFSVTSFKLDDYDAKESVQLIGEKKLSIGDFVGLVTPKIRWDNGNYRFVDELRIAVTELLFEVEEYMRGNKKGEADQPELPFNSEEEAYAEEEL
jgi:hypothetical protein